MPVLKAPKDGARDQAPRPLFKWFIPKEAEEDWVYRLIVDGQADDQFVALCNDCSFSAIGRRQLDPGAHSWQVAVLDGNSAIGESPEATFSVGEVPDGPIGVTINEGDLYTNDPNVVLSPVWPDDGQEIQVSNDGGFKPSKTFGLKQKIDWKLDSSGPERLPKTVYMRFENFSTAHQPQQYTDDIILDETNPQIQSASVEGGGSKRVLARASKAKLIVKAKDKLSGVRDMQIAVGKRSAAGKWRRYKRAVSVNGGGKVFVRVRDRAGNPSKWVRANN